MVILYYITQQDIVEFVIKLVLDVLTKIVLVKGNNLRVLIFKVTNQILLLLLMTIRVTLISLFPLHQSPYMI